MSAPIRDEHRQAARALMQALGVEMSGEQGEINEEAIAAVLAARDADAVASIPAVRIKATLCLYCGSVIEHTGVLDAEGMKAIRDAMGAHDLQCKNNPLVAAVSALRAEHATLTRALRRLSSATNTHPYLSTPLEELRAAWRDTGAALSLPLAKEVPDA